MFMLRINKTDYMCVVTQRERRENHNTHTNSGSSLQNLASIQLKLSRTGRYGSFLFLFINKTGTEDCKCLHSVYYYFYFLYDANLHNTIKHMTTVGCHLSLSHFNLLVFRGKFYNTQDISI